MLFALLCKSFIFHLSPILIRIMQNSWSFMEFKFAEKILHKDEKICSSTNRDVKKYFARSHKTLLSLTNFRNIFWVLRKLGRKVNNNFWSFVETLNSSERMEPRPRLFQQKELQLRYCNSLPVNCLTRPNLYLIESITLLDFPYSNILTYFQIPHPYRPNPKSLTPNLQLEEFFSNSFG